MYGVNTDHLDVASAVSDFLTVAGVDTHDIDEIVFVEQRVRLVSTTVLKWGYREEIGTPFQVGRLWEEALVIQQRFWLVSLLSRLLLSHLQ